MKTFLIAAAICATAGGVAYAAQQVPPAPPAPAMAPPPHKPMMPRADVDRDGVITRAEYLAQAGQRFDRIDANRDGRIDAAERQAMRGQMGMRGQGMGGRRGWRAQGMDDMPPPPAPNQ